MLDFFKKRADGEELATWAENAVYKPADSQRRKVEWQWGTNILFLSGNQKEAAAEDMRRYGRIPVAVPSGLSQKAWMVCNKIYPLVRQASATVADNIAQQIAIAATGDPVDGARAELATDLLEARFYDDREAEKRRAEVLWGMTCGLCARFTYWDVDADGYTIAGPVSGIGDVESVTLNPWQFHISPWADNPLDSPFYILSDIKSVEEVNDLYTGHDVQGEEVADAARWMDRLVTAIVAGDAMTSSSAPKRDGAVLLKRMYCQPTAKYPQGRVITWANGKTLGDTTLPDGKMPITVLPWFPLPGSGYPLPFVTPLRDLQHQINIALSQLIELKNRQLRGDIVMSGAGDVTQEFAREAVAWDAEGNATQWRRGAAKIIKLGPGVTNFQMMNYALNTNEAEVLIARLWNDMMDGAGVRETSLGNTPPTGTTATQVIALKDSDHQGLAYFRAGYDLAHSRISTQKLTVAKNHYDIPRMIKVVGAKNSVRTEAFFGSDLGNTIDVRPKPLPIITEAQALQIRTELAAQGAFDLTGTAQQKLNKVKVLLNSGVPGIREEVEALLGGITVEQLEEACAEINKLEIEANMLQVQGIVEQLKNPPQPAGPAGPQPNGMENLPPEAQMAMAAG